MRELWRVHPDELGACLSFYDLPPVGLKAILPPPVTDVVRVLSIL